MEFKQFAVCKSHRKSLLDVFELGPQPCNMLLWRAQLHGGPNKTLRCSDMAWHGVAWCGILDGWMNGWMDGCRSCNLKRLPVSSCCLLAVVGMFRSLHVSRCPLHVTCWSVTCWSAAWCLLPGVRC